MSNKPEDLTRREFIVRFLAVSGALTMGPSLFLPQKSEGIITNLLDEKKVNWEPFSIEEKNARRVESNGKETTHTTYHLAYNAKNIGSRWEKGISYIHPPKKFYSHLSDKEIKRLSECPSRWFIDFGLTSCLNPFSEDTPKLIKFIYECLGDDPDLSLVKHWPVSNSARLYFPKYYEDIEFHKKKMNLLNLSWFEKKIEDA